MLQTLSLSHTDLKVSFSFRNLNDYWLPSKRSKSSLDPLKICRVVNALLLRSNCIPFGLQLYTFWVATVYLLGCNCVPFGLQLCTFCVATVYLLRCNCVPFAG